MIGRILLIATLLVLATGCGQKGPLYRPEPPTADETDEQSGKKEAN